MKTEYDNELLIKLELEIKENKINVHENVESFINEIEANYPMGFSGIDWLEKKPLLFVGYSDESDLLENIADGFSKMLNICPELLEERILVIGDGLTNLGYEMRFNDFIKLNKIFLTIPQHTYIWFIDSKRCINITFENEMIFG